MSEHAPFRFPRCAHAPAGACTDPACEFFNGRRPEEEPPPRRAPDLLLPPARPKPLDTAPFPPAALETWKRMQELERRRDGTGAVRVNVEGRDESGRIPEGACSWEYRPPIYLAPRPDSRDGYLRINGKDRWQPDAPVHVNNAPFGSAKDVKRHVRIIGEAEAARRYFRKAVGDMPVDVLGLSANGRERAKRERRRR